MATGGSPVGKMKGLRMRAECYPGFGPYHDVDSGQIPAIRDFQRGRHSRIDQTGIESPDESVLGTRCRGRTEILPRKRPMR